MNKNQRLITLRTRKLGVLILDARLATRRSVNECAEALGISPDAFTAFENGETAPSLPQLEALAYFFDLPLEHFWGNESLSENMDDDSLNNAGRLAELRNRIIGTRLKMLREERGLTLEQLSSLSSIPVEQLNQDESGLTDVALPELETLAAALETRIESFFDDHGAIGAWRARQTAVRKFLDLPEQQQQFILQPVNRPYLDLAIRLSELSVDKLRGIAEGLLEITY